MGTVDLSLEISRLLCYGLQKGLLAPEDAAYSANRILALLGISEFEWKPVEEKLRFPAEPLERICDWAAEQSLIDPDTLDGRDSVSYTHLHAGARGMDRCLGYQADGRV